MKNLTPHHLRCAWGACPAAYESNDGSLLIIGQKASAEHISKYKADIGDNERAIVVSKELLANIKVEADKSAV